MKQVPMPEHVEQLAITRYRPVPNGMFGYKVVAGDGARSVFEGTKSECTLIARKLTEAFLDGAHVAGDAREAAGYARGRAEANEDANAFRLLVKLRLDVEVNDASVVVQLPQDKTGGSSPQIYEYPDQDYDKDFVVQYSRHEAAARRAITRAAAQAKKETQMTPQERSRLIDQLDRSFTMMPHWVKCATKNAIGAPTNNPETGQPFTSFREVIEAASDESLLILRDDFDDNGDLLPAVATQKGGE